MKRIKIIQEIITTIIIDSKKEGIEMGIEEDQKIQEENTVILEMVEVEVRKTDLTLEIDSVIGLEVLVIEEIIPLEEGEENKGWKLFYLFVI